MPGPETARDDLIDTAAGWLAALDAGSADFAAFSAWRDADPRHAIAFAEVAATWQELDRLRHADAAPAITPAPVPLAEAGTETGAGAVRHDRRQLLRAAAGIAAVAVIGGVAYRGEARGTGTTGIGERRTLTPAPGVALDLNTDSAVEWRDAAPLRLWLTRGEVAIRLTHGRAAELTTPAGRFRLDPGTFNARLRGGGCELAVIAGTLRSDDGGSAGGGARLGPGAVALATAGRLAPRTTGAAELARVTAWQHDTLMLSGESLDYALAEINRYLPGKIVIGDPALSRLRIGGTFATRDPGEFLRALRTSFGVHASRDAQGGVVLTRA